MITEDLGVNPGVEHQRVDIGEQGIEKVLSQPFTLLLIK